MLKINPKTKILHRKIKNMFWRTNSKENIFFFKNHWGLLVNQADEIQYVKLQRQKLGVYISSGNISLCLAGKKFGNKSSSFLRLTRPTGLHRKFFQVRKWGCILHGTRNPYSRVLFSKVWNHNIYLWSKGLHQHWASSLLSIVFVAKSLCIFVYDGVNGDIKFQKQSC